MSTDISLTSERGRIALSSSSNDVLRRSSESTPTKPIPIRRESSLPNLHHHRSTQSDETSNSPPSSPDSIFPAQVCGSLKEKLDEIPPTRVFSMGNTSFDMLPSPPYDHSNSSLHRDSPNLAGPTRSNPTAQDHPNPYAQLQIPTLGSISDVHWPTRLDPIIEQRSRSTLRDGLNLNLRQKASVISQLSRRRSRSALQKAAEFRRRGSYSLTDLPSSKSASKLWTRDACDRDSWPRSAWARTSCCSSQATSRRASLSSIYDATYPVRPSVSPPSRAETPAGLPSFNSPAAQNFRLPRPHFGFRERLRGTSREAEREWRLQTSNLPRGVVMRGEDGTLVRARWRPVQSGHTGYPDSRPVAGAGAAGLEAVAAGGLADRVASARPTMSARPPSSRPPSRHASRPSSRPGTVHGNARAGAAEAGQMASQGSEAHGGDGAAWLKALLCCFSSET